MATVQCSELFPPSLHSLYSIQKTSTTQSVNWSLTMSSLSEFYVWFYVELRWNLPSYRLNKAMKKKTSLILSCLYYIPSSVRCSISWWKQDSSIGKLPFSWELLLPRCDVLLIYRQRENDPFIPVSEINMRGLVTHSDWIILVLIEAEDCQVEAIVVWAVWGL